MTDLQYQTKGLAVKTTKENMEERLRMRISEICQSKHNGSYMQMAKDIDCSFMNLKAFQTKVLDLFGLELNDLIKICEACGYNLNIIFGQ